MITRVVGFKPPSTEWRRMAAVWDACVAAGVGIPEAVTKFFHDRPPDSMGAEVTHEVLIVAGAIVPIMSPPTSRPEDLPRSGYELRVDRIPLGVTIIRFENLG